MPRTLHADKSVRYIQRKRIKRGVREADPHIKRCSKKQIVYVLSSEDVSLAVTEREGIRTF
jgi:hypothetical protein